MSVINFHGCNTSFWKRIDVVNRDRVLMDTIGCSPDRVILLPARVVWEKGIPYLHEAMSYIDDDIHLIMAGAGSDAYIESLTGKERAIHDRLIDRVHYVGHVDKYMLRILYNIADIVVLPSIPIPIWIEQFGRALTEAMACETPCISTNLGGPLDIIDEGVTGYLIPPGDPTAIADAINKMYEYKGKLVGMGIQSRERVMEKFSDEIAYRKMSKCCLMHTDTNNRMFLTVDDVIGDN
jgi:glycosyltransferase involved in cell wall biosynthesis